MIEEDIKRRQVDQFIIEQVESVPHLEALLLMWNSRPRQWSLQEMAKALYLSQGATEPILQDLARRGLIALEPGAYSYQEDEVRNNLIHNVDQMYRRELVRISNMIHSKPPASVRAFAQAFKFKKD
jgi:predicted ArsR family transcriptional regulator